MHLLTFATGEDIVIRTDFRGDFSSHELEPLAASENRNTLIVDLVRHFIETESRQVYVSCLPGNRCQHSYVLSDLLQENPITDPVTGEPRLLKIGITNSYEPTSYIETVKRDFELGDIDVILDTNLLSEGYDTSRIGAMVLASPTTSPAHWSRFARQPASSIHNYG